MSSSDGGLSFMIPEVNVSVVSEYIGKQKDSDGELNYQFAYQVTIANKSEVQVQLLSRHWWITDQFNNITEVEGEGVVGKKPVIKPQQSFTYTSGTNLATPVGTMQGIYLLRSELGLPFDVVIPEFLLASKRHLH